MQSHGVNLVPNVKPLCSNDVPISLALKISQNIGKKYTNGPSNANNAPKTVDI